MLRPATRYFERVPEVDKSVAFRVAVDQNSVLSIQGETHTNRRANLW